MTDTTPTTKADCVSLWRSVAVAPILAVMLSSGIVLVPQSASAVAPDDSAFCNNVSDLRSNYSILNRAIAARTVQNNPDKIDEWDIEDDSCISSYGVDLGFSFTSITSSLLDSLADQACSALDSFIGDQIGALDSSVTAPMDMAGLDVGFGEQDNPLSVDTRREDINVDFESAFDDQLDRLPGVDSGYDYDGSGGRSVDDFDYLNTRPNYDGGRR